MEGQDPFALTPEEEQLTQDILARFDTITSSLEQTVTNMEELRQFLQGERYGDAANELLHLGRRLLPIMASLKMLRREA